MNDLAPVSDIARTIQLTIAPVFLLAGIGAFLNVIAGRLNRVVDRSRHIAALHPDSTGEEHDQHVWELRLLDRRISLASNAIFLCVASGLTVCLLVTMLFISEIAHFNFGRAIMLLFVIAMGLLAIGLVLFLIETRVAVGGIRIREDLLERETSRRFRF